MRGTFRRDLELARGGAPGTLRLTRKRRARVVSVALAVVSLAAGVLDLLAGRPWIATAQLALAIAFLALLWRAELESWRFDGEELVRREFSLRSPHFRETRLGARNVRGIGLAREDGRARAWIETRGGQQFALIEGDVREVEQIAEAVRRALQLATLEPPSRTVH